MDLPDLSDFEMIIFDIDGTLLDIEGFQEELIPLIRIIEQGGITISLASGRTLPNVTPIQQSLAVSGFVVGENGGMVWDTHAGFPIHSLADGKRTRDAANWLASQIDGLDPAGIESNRWRETEWCLKDDGNYEAAEGEEGVIPDGNAAVDQGLAALGLLEQSVCTYILIVFGF